MHLLSLGIEQLLRQFDSCRNLSLRLNYARKPPEACPASLRVGLKCSWFGLKGSHWVKPLKTSPMYPSTLFDTLSQCDTETTSSVGILQFFFRSHPINAAYHAPPCSVAAKEKTSPHICRHTYGVNFPRVHARGIAGSIPLRLPYVTAHSFL